MKIFDSNVEILVAKSLCDSSMKTLILSRISEDYFGSDQGKEIYRRIMVLLNSGKAPPSSEVLRNDDALSDSAKAFLSSTCTPLESEEDIEASVGALTKYRKARIILRATEQAISSMQVQDPDVDAVVSSMESMLQQCRSGVSTSEMKHYSRKDKASLVAELAQQMDEPDEGVIPSGFAEYDKKSGGFRRRSVLVLASPPGGGKSAMAQQMALNHYLMGLNVCYINYEMDEIEMKYRALSSISAIDHSSISLKRLTKSAKQHILTKWEEFLEGSGGNNRLTIWTPAERELSVPEIANELKPYGYDVVYIDYLGLLKMDPKKAMHEMLGEHTRNSKLAANKLNALFVVLAQLDDEELKIKYSKAIKANAHTIWAWACGEREIESGIVEIDQQKARGSHPFPFLLSRDMKIMRFSDYFGPPPAKPEEQPQPQKKAPKMASLKK